MRKLPDRQKAPVINNNPPKQQVITKYIHRPNYGDPIYFNLVPKLEQR
ncbi:MAG: hypothetical protein OEU90_15280 [Gammaproteobacteria bacterium]|nr:hypothetical protein [Gammaproteobacteria bacterium]MDH3806815.1 hypothetical protein [Gammaproteobacteria bacterium]